MTDKRSLFLYVLKHGISVEEMETLAFDYFREGVYLHWTPEMNAERRRIMLVEYAFNHDREKLLELAILEINKNAFLWGEDYAKVNQGLQQEVGEQEHKRDGARGQAAKASGGDCVGNGPTSKEKSGNAPQA